jgi:heme exporter protein D
MPAPESVGGRRAVASDDRGRLMSEFLAMGGYAAYVWSAFGFAALVLLALLAHSVWSARRREEELARLREVVRAAPTGAPAVRRPRRAHEDELAAPPVGPAPGRAGG